MIERDFVLACIRDALMGRLLPPMGMDRFERAVDVAADAVMEAIRYDATCLGGASVLLDSGPPLLNSEPSSDPTFFEPPFLS